MIKDITAVKTGAIWNGGQGASFKDTIEAAPDFGPEIRLNGTLYADLMLIRMKNGISAVLSNIKTGVEQTCARCLDNYVQPLQIASAEAHFYEEPPQHDYDLLEVYLVQTRDMSIDLTDALRQEIILHFPMIPVCSNRCKGLCPSCTVNLNHQPHKKGCPEASGKKTPPPAPDIYQPFADLKKLIKKKN